MLSCLDSALSCVPKEEEQSGEKSITDTGDNLSKSEAQSTTGDARRRPVVLAYSSPGCWPTVLLGAGPQFSGVLGNDLKEEQWEWGK